MLVIRNCFVAKPGNGSKLAAQLKEAASVANIPKYRVLTDLTGEFNRVLRLPIEVDPNRVEATLKDGVLLVKLPKTGEVLLSGDAVHFKSNWDNRRVPTPNFSKEATLLSMEKIAATLERDNAQLWINHDKAQRDTLKLAPDFYE